MKKAQKSSQWHQAHQADPFVKQARANGYRSRAVYKLKEVNETYTLIRPGMRILELGAAPGGWTQYVVQQLKQQGQIIAVDCLEMQDVSGITFVHGDFTEPDIQQTLLERLAGQKADLILSDMAPNLSGIKSMDSLRAIALAEVVLETTALFLKPTGHLFMKIFHGAGFDTFLQQARTCFDKVNIIKPGASQAQSRETYLLARGYHL